MKTARVQLYGITGKHVVVNTDATAGATVGSDLKWPDGSTVTEAQLRAASAPSGGSSSDISTSDDLDEGQYNIYFTQQRAQDAVGGILVDTATIDFTYDGSAHLIKADLKDLSNAGGGSLVKVNRDAKGRVAGTSSASTDDLSEGVANLYFTPARVNGALAGGDGITLSFISGITTITLTGLPVFLLSQIGDQLTDQAGNLLIGNQTTGLPVDWPDITSKPTSVSGYGITDAQVIGTPVKLPRYTFAGKPSAATYIDTLIIISDLSGGPGPCWSNGTNWLLVGSNAIASP